VKERGIGETEREKGRGSERRDREGERKADIENIGDIRP